MYVCKIYIVLLYLSLNFHFDIYFNFYKIQQKLQIQYEIYSIFLSDGIRKKYVVGLWGLMTGENNRFIPIYIHNFLICCYLFHFEKITQDKKNYY